MVDKVNRIVAVWRLGLRDTVTAFQVEQQDKRCEYDTRGIRVGEIHVEEIPCGVKQQLDYFAQHVCGD
jgi:hypothetical protein